MAASQKIRSNRPRRTEFPLRPTNKAKTLAVLPLVLAVYLAYYGVSTFLSFHPADEMRYAMGLPPIGLAILLLAVLVVIPKKMCRGTIRILDTGIEFDPGNHDLNQHFPWRDLIFSCPGSPQRMVRTLLLIHREKKLLVYDLFVPHFSQLLEEIQRRKPKSAGLNSDAGIKIDSGKLGNIDRGMTGR